MRNDQRSRKRVNTMYNNDQRSRNVLTTKPLHTKNMLLVCDHRTMTQRQPRQELRSTRPAHHNTSRPGRHRSAEEQASEQRIIRNRIRRQREMRRHLQMFLATVCLIAICSFTLNAFRSNAKNDVEVSDKYYKSISISKHDTLWSIAEQYMDDAHYDSIQDYIAEVRQMNSIKGDAIRYGEYLIVPYYISNSGS